MAHTYEELAKIIRNPEILKLIKSFETMPEYLAEKRRKRLEREEFVRYVWEKACRDAGLVK